MILKLQSNQQASSLSHRIFLLAALLLASGGPAHAETHTNTMLFCDDFNSSNTVTPPPPWTSQSGTWNLSANELECGLNNSFTYGRLCLVTNWTDYTVQAQIMFGPNGYGGGLGGRLNPTTGEHYAVWIYPRYDAGAGKLLRLVRFINWTTWTLLAQTNVDLPEGSTHTLQLSFAGNEIAAAFDGQELAHATDNTLTSGGISAEMWTDWSSYIFHMDSLAVTTGPENVIAPIPVTINSITAREDGNMHLSATGTPEQEYQLQAVTDLENSNWQSIATNTADIAGLVSFDDLNATNYPQRFYRTFTP